MSITTATRAQTPDVGAIVERIVGVHARIAELQAHEATLLAELLECVLAGVEDRRAAGLTSDVAVRSACAEVGAALRVSDRTVQARLGEASRLVDDYPATLDALRCGSIERGHATAILDAGLSIADDGARARYEAFALEVARNESVPRTRAALRAIAAAVDPGATQAAMERAHRDRGVRVYDLPHGMARLLADLPAHLAYAIHDRLTRIAHELDAPARAATPAEPGDLDPVDDPGSKEERTTDGRTTDAGTTDAGTTDAGTTDERTTDERRADILADLLLTATTSAHGAPEAMAAITGRVQVTVPALTLAGEDDAPALLAGYGPIDAATACDLAARTPGWDRVMTDPHTGLPLAVDRYRPSAELRRFLAARDEHCRFPGCRVTTWRCDIDHTVAAAEGGPTAATNLAHFCRRHHTMKHATEWTVRQRPGGVLEWTSPHGRTIRDKPAPSVRFVPDHDPPPF